MSDRTGSSSFGFGHAESDDISWGGGGVPLNSPTHVQTQRGRIVSERNFYRNSVHSQRDSFYDAAIGFNPMPPGLQDYSMSQRSQHHQQQHYNNRNCDNRPRSGVNFTTNTSHHIPWSPTGSHNRPHSGSMAQFYDPFVHSDNLVRRLVAERDAIMHEYSTVMSERDKVHEEMDRLSSELSSSRNRVEEMELVVQNKSTEVNRLVSEVASVKLLYWNLAENLDELKATMLHQMSTVEDVASFASMHDVISRQIDAFISENSAIVRRRNRSRNNSGFSSLSLRGRNIPRLRRRSSSSQDEHERSLLDLLQVTDHHYVHSSFRESRDRNDTMDALQVFNGGPTLNGFTLFMERIRNLRQELAERNFEISSNANEISSLKTSMNNYRSDNSSLLLEIEKLRGENVKMRGNMAKFPKVEFVQVPGSAFNEQKFTLKVGFYQNSEFNWSNFGVMLSDITGSLTVIEVKPTSVFHKLLKPKMKLRSIGNQSVKSWQDMHAKLSNRSVSYLFTFVQTLGRSRSDKAVQTEKVSEVREQLSRKTSSVVRPVSGFEPSPFTRNSTLRSPLAKNSSETLNRCRGTSGLSELHRKRHRSYSPSIDLNWLNSCSPFMSSPVFQCDSRRHRTLPRNRTELDWLSKRRSEPFRTMDESLVDGREPATNGTLSEENSDNMFEEALMELDEQNNSTEMQIMEDLESIFSSGPESSGIASPVKTPETAFDRKLTFTNFAGTSENVTESLKVAHKHVASEPLQTEEKSTQAEDVENEKNESDKDDANKHPSELTWPRMRQNVLNIKGTDLSRNGNANPVVNTIRGDEKGKGSPRSVRIPFMKDGKKRTSIMGFKFSPAASLRSKNSSKCSNSSRYRSPNESCEDNNGSSLSPTPSRQSFSVSSRKHSEGERPKKPSPINRSNSMSCEASSSVVFDCCEPMGRVVFESSLHMSKSPLNALKRQFPWSKRCFSRFGESSTCYGLKGRHSHVSSSAWRDQEDPKRLISLTRANVSQGFGFCFAGGNLWGLFVTKVTPTLHQLLQVGDKILEINGIEAVEATFEEFIILLKTYPGLEITLLVQEKLTSYRDMEANHSLQRDKFYVRVMDMSTEFCGEHSDNSAQGLKLKRGDVISVRDSMHSGRIGTWYASKVDERNIDLVENSGTVHSMYHRVLVLLNQKGINEKSKHLASLDVISEEDKRSHSGSHTTVGSFRRFFMKRIGSSSSYSGINATSPNTGSDLNSLGSSIMNLTDIGGPHAYEFQRVKYFDSNFQRPVVFVGILSEALIAFFARTYQKRFKIVDFAKLEENRNLDVDNESLNDDSLASSFNRGQVKSFKAICSELPKGSHALIACDTNRLKLLYELGMHPLVFAYDPNDNQKSVKDIYFWLTEGRSLASKKAKRLIVRSRSVHNELKKMKMFWGRLSGSLSEVEGMVVKHTEQISNFNLFIDEQPNELRVALTKQVADYVNSRE